MNEHTQLIVKYEMKREKTFDSQYAVLHEKLSIHFSFLHFSLAAVYTIDLCECVVFFFGVMKKTKKEKKK